MRGINQLKSKLPDYCHIVQQGAGDCNIVFPEKYLHDLDKLGIIHLRHRTQYSNEQREAMSQRMYKLQELGKMNRRLDSHSS